MASWSWHQAIEHIASGLAALGNPVLAGRAADLRDVGRRVLAQLDPSAAGGGLADLPAHPCILIAADLSPSDTANLDTTRVIGLATAQGGPTSHTAILSRTLGLPALVAGASCSRSGRSRGDHRRQQRAALPVSVRGRSRLGARLDRRTAADPRA
jgi:phosphocarrier protein FPr